MHSIPGCTLHTVVFQLVWTVWQKIERHSCGGEEKWTQVKVKGWNDKWTEKKVKKAGWWNDSYADFCKSWQPRENMGKRKWAPDGKQLNLSWAGNERKMLNSELLKGSERKMLNGEHLKGFKLELLNISSQQESMSFWHSRLQADLWQSNSLDLVRLCAVVIRNGPADNVPWQVVA